MNELDRCYQLYEDLQSQRNEMISALKGWDPERVTRRPAPESWSAVEVLDHLAKSEHGILNQVHKGLKDPHPFGIAARVASRVRVTALERALRSSHRFPVPPGAGKSRPDSAVTLPYVEERWEQTRVELRHTLESLRPVDLEGGVFCHPVAGWMTVPDVLRNFSAHLHHHTFQLARISVTLSSDAAV